MAILDIITYHDNINLLRKKSKKIKDIRSGSLSKLVKDMAETMYAAPGLGLSAIQVGIPKRLFIIDVSQPGLIVAINPQVKILTDKQEEGLEGCLSFPDIYGDVLRPIKIKLIAYDLKGNKYELELSDLSARAVLHELDHLNGNLFVDVAKNLREEVDEEVLV